MPDVENGQDNALMLPLRFTETPGLISRYANNMFVNHSASEFIISFYEIRPPLLLGTPEQVQEQVESIESVDAECVVRIIVPPDRLPGIIKALQENYEKFQSNAPKAGLAE